MKTLYLLCHAHTTPSGLGLADFDRPLDKRGQQESQALAQYLTKQKITFDFVMCSAALRAQETLEPLRPVIGTTAIEISESYYNISEDVILSHLQELPDTINKVLYIGHNPGIAFSILRFSTKIPQLVMEGITPGTLTGFTFDLQQWEDLNWGQGDIIDIFQPPQES